MDKREYLREQSDGTWREIFEWDVYRVSPEDARDRCVVDIGGHFGFASLKFHDLGAKSVTVLEPNPINYIQLLRNTMPYSNIRQINAACGTISGDIIQISNDGSSSTCSLVTTTWVRAQRKYGFSAVTISLDDIVALFEPKERLILKLDAEGIEHILLKQFQAHVWRRFELLAVELHGEPYAGQGNTAEAAMSIIESYGFSLTWCGRGYLRMPDGTIKTDNNLVICKYRRD